jgi:hypothetical protein
MDVTGIAVILSHQKRDAPMTMSSAGMARHADLNVTLAKRMILYHSLKNPYLWPASYQKTWTILAGESGQASYVTETDTASS